MERVAGQTKGLRYLRYLQDLDYPEIAQILSCSQESARANVYQAIRHLRLAVEEEK